MNRKIYIRTLETQIKNTEGYLQRLKDLLNVVNKNDKRKIVYALWLNNKGKVKVYSKKPNDNLIKKSFHSATYLVDDKTNINEYEKFLNTPIKIKKKQLL